MSVGRRSWAIVRFCTALADAVLSGLFVLPLFLVAAIARLRRGGSLVWGPVPIINNKYWSEAVAGLGYRSQTYMEEYYGAINRREDFDAYLDELPLPIWPRTLRLRTARFVAFGLCLWRHAVFHIPFSGFLLGSTPLWRLEPILLRLAGRRTVILPYGSDFYVYARIIDPCLRHGLLMSYPDNARRQAAIAARVALWERHADVVVGSFQVDGIGRWDVLPFSHLSIDTRQWAPRTSSSDADGIAGVVTVVHAPNHRGIKGTEFLVAAIEQLRTEGLKVELILLEKRPNIEVRDILRDKADILAEQFVITCYAMSGIEGMASGLPVLSNLEHPAYTQAFRRYSCLDECPILSTTPETLVRNLRILVRNPALRRELGLAGRAYVENFHSYAAARVLFGSIYRRLLDGADVDLINLYHPLKSEWRRSLPKVRHPLVGNHLPADHPACCAI